MDVVELPLDQVERARALFASVFGHPVSREHWRWKYQDGPRLGSVNVAARDARGDWVGHAGAIVFPGAFQGRGLAMAQVCDVMVEKSARGGLAREGVFPRLLVGLRQRLLARHPEAFAYGFPGTRPFKLGERMGFYRRIHACTAGRIPDPIAAFWPIRRWTAHEADWDEQRLDRLWEFLAHGQRGPIVARTGAFVGWRYRDHPGREYRLWLLKEWRSEAGWFITRCMPDGSHYVVDALLRHPSDARGACAALWIALARQGGEAPTIETWIAPPASTSIPIVPMEFQLRAGGLGLPAPDFQPGDTDVY